MHEFEVQANALAVEDFNAVLCEHPSGVKVSTADEEEGSAALTASPVASVSAQPPQLVSSVSALSAASEILKWAEAVVDHFL